MNILWYTSGEFRVAVMRFYTNLSCIIGYLIVNMWMRESYWASLHSCTLYNYQESTSMRCAISIFLVIVLAVWHVPYKSKWTKKEAYRKCAIACFKAKQTQTQTQIQIVSLIFNTLSRQTHNALCCVLCVEVDVCVRVGLCVCVWPNDKIFLLPAIYYLQ